MIWAFPETGTVVGGVEITLGIATPIPFSIYIINEIFLDILPTAQRFFQCRLIAEILIDVVESHYGLGLHPPVPYRVIHPILAFIEEGMAAIGPFKYMPGKS